VLHNFIPLNILVQIFQHWKKDKFWYYTFRLSQKTYNEDCSKKCVRDISLPILCFTIHFKQESKLKLSFVWEANYLLWNNMTDSCHEGIFGWRNNRYYTKHTGFFFKLCFCKSDKVRLRKINSPVLKNLL